MDEKLRAAIAAVLKADERFAEALEGNTRADATADLFDAIGELRAIYEDEFPPLVLEVVEGG
jgi:hypothetical protein